MSTRSNRLGSKEYPQSMFLSRNKKNNVYPCKPQFYYIKVVFKEVNIILACFRDGDGDEHENVVITLIFEHMNS